jgi:hypothetical protein
MLAFNSESTHPKFLNQWYPAMPNPTENNINPSENNKLLRIFLLKS